MKKAFQPKALISLFGAANRPFSGNLFRGYCLGLYPIAAAFPNLSLNIRILLQKAPINTKTKKINYFTVTAWK